MPTRIESFLILIKRRGNIPPISNPWEINQIVDVSVAPLILDDHIFIDLNGNGNKPFTKESLKSIIFGVKTPKKEVTSVQNLCKKMALSMFFLNKQNFTASIWNNTGWYLNIKLEHPHRRCKLTSEKQALNTRPY